MCVRVCVLLCFLCWHRVDVPLLCPACAGGSLRLHTEPTGQNKAPVTVPPRFAILSTHLSFQSCTLNEGLLSLHDLKASLLIWCFSSPRINHTQGWGFGGKGHVKTCGVALCMNNSTGEICVIRWEGLKYSQSWCEFRISKKRSQSRPVFAVLVQWTLYREYFETSVRQREPQPSGVLSRNRYCFRATQDSWGVAWPQLWLHNSHAPEFPQQRFFFFFSNLHSYEWMWLTLWGLDSPLLCI